MIGPNLSDRPSEGELDSSAPRFLGCNLSTAGLSGRDKRAQGEWGDRIVPPFPCSFHHRNCQVVLQSRSGWLAARPPLAVFGSVLFDASKPAQHPSGGIACFRRQSRAQASNRGSDRNAEAAAPPPALTLAAGTRSQEFRCRRPSSGGC